MKKRDTSGIEFIGYDLGHGETALARAFSSTHREPEILEYHGERTFVTAVMRNKDGIAIGNEAVSAAALGGDEELWIKFKSRDHDDPATETPTRHFTRKLFSELEADGQIRSRKDSHILIGCPSGWTEDERGSYAELIRNSGLEHVRVVPESRAALMTALEQGYLSLEAARDTVLIIDIGSSTTDFTYCRDLQAEDVGHNFLGSGLLDTLIYERNLARQKDRKKIEKLLAKYPAYQPIFEYWCRLAKEQYFNGEEKPVELIRRLPIAGGAYFEIRVDKKDADAILSQPIAALNGYTWPEAFDYALDETLQALDGRVPNTVLLTGGASRLPLVFPATQKLFPGSEVKRGAEPEFAIARGLAWLGRFEHLHASFKREVAALTRDDGAVTDIASEAADSLGERLSPVLVDAMLDAVVIPAFQEWRAGKVDRLVDIEETLKPRLAEWLDSEDARDRLRPEIADWFAQLQRNIERETDPLCRDHGLPAMVLSLDDSAHIARHLEGLSVGAPALATLEQDTAIAGTTLTAILIGVVLAKAQLLAPLLANPLTFIIGGALGLGGVIYGRKAIEGKMRSANIPVMARKLVTDKRMRKAADGQRGELIAAVEKVWNESAAERVKSELIETLHTALSERIDERAVLFLL